jgi:proteasome lid subunit RPN8/RPN11
MRASATRRSFSIVIDARCMTRGSYFCANGVAEEQLAVWSPTEKLVLCEARHREALQPAQPPSAAVHSHPNSGCRASSCHRTVHRPPLAAKYGNHLD